MSGALEGIRILDVAFAGPLAATVLGDYGAEVLKIEHPRGDALRSHGAVLARVRRVADLSDVRALMNVLVSGLATGPA